jgi:hypothetical protein
VFLRPATDLDGDGVRDLVWAVELPKLTGNQFAAFGGDGTDQGTAACLLLAVSGADGHVLWWRLTRYGPIEAASGLVAALAGEPQTWPIAALSGLHGLDTLLTPVLAGDPLVVEDLADDGCPILITVYASLTASAGQSGPEYRLRPWVEALSGRTGQVLWRYDGAAQSNSRLTVTPGSHAELALQAEVSAVGIAPFGPPVLMPLLELAHSASPEAIGYYSRESPLRRTPHLLGHNYWHEFVEKGNEWLELPGRCANLTLTGAGERRVLLAGLFKQLVRLDLRTGKPLGPPIPVEAPVLAWSKDGDTALLDRKVVYDGVHALSDVNKHVFRVVDAESGAVRGPTVWGNAEQQGGTPLLIDLNGDGFPELIWRNIIVDGATGKVRLEMCGERRSAVLAGPDLDGDGCRDLFFVSVVDGERFGRAKGTHMLLVEARSGKEGREFWPGRDGRAFWQRVEPLRDDLTVNPSDVSLVYWQVSPHGPAWLAVAVGGRLQSGGDFRQTYLFAPGTGRVEHVWPGVLAAGTADLDGDGLTDLYGYGGGKLYAIRGTTPEVWRRPGKWWSAWPPLELREVHEDRVGPLCFAPTLPVGDLDGDGVADVLLFRPSGSSSGPKEPVLQAYSGKSGRRLWQYDLPHLYDENGNYGPPEGFSVSVCRLLHCVDLDGDGRPEVVFAYGGLSRNGPESRLVILDGRTGRVRWQQDGLSDYPPDLASLATSGGAALVVAIKDPKDSQKIEEFRALDGATGRTIRTWQQRTPNSYHEWPEELHSLNWPELGPGGLGWRNGWRWNGVERSRGCIRDTPDGPPGELFCCKDLEDVTYFRRPVPVGKPAFDFSGIDPRLSVPVPWVERAPQRWLPALGAGLAYLALVAGFTLARRWWVVVGLLACLLVVPATTMPWQFDEAHRLFAHSAEERRDWTGWYWFWPDRLSCWSGWETRTNPLVGAGAWFLLWAAVHYLRRVRTRQNAA